MADVLATCGDQSPEKKEAETASGSAPSRHECGKLREACWGETGSPQ